jgi:hypothetical protein
MRCLFIADEPDRFREVTAALEAAGLTASLCPDARSAQAALHQTRFDIVIVAPNAFTSEPMLFLHAQKRREFRLLAVTHEPLLRDALIGHGAEWAIVLPDRDRRLKRALAMLQDQERRRGSQHVHPMLLTLKRAWQRGLRLIF